MCGGRAPNSRPHSQRKTSWKIETLGLPEELMKYGSMLADQMVLIKRIGSERLRSGMLRPTKSSPMRQGGMMRRKNGEAGSPSLLKNPRIVPIQFLVSKKILNQIFVDPLWLFEMEPVGRISVSDHAPVRALKQACLRQLVIKGSVLASPDDKRWRHDPTQYGWSSTD